MDGLLTGGEGADVKVGPELTKDILGCAVIGDRGYDSNEFRWYLRGNNNTPVIPGRRNRKALIIYDRQRYKKRGIIERTFVRIKESRCLVVRYEKADVNLLSFILLAFIKIQLLKLCLQCLEIDDEIPEGMKVLFDKIVNDPDKKPSIKTNLLCKEKDFRNYLS